MLPVTPLRQHFYNKHSKTRAMRYTTAPGVVV